MRAAFLLAIAGCAPAATWSDTGDLDEPRALPADHTRHYTLWLGGARVGTATETERWSADGVALRRTEQLAFARGDAVVVMNAQIEVAADAALVPRRVAWREWGGAGGEHAVVATRDAAGWHGDGLPADLPAGAIPAELIPLYVRRDGAFTGGVFLPARGFVAGAGRVVAIGPRRVVSELALGNGARAESTTDLDADGTPARVVDGEGVIELRASEAEAAATFAPVDLVSATAIPIRGGDGGGDAGGDADATHLALDDDAAIPALPGQRARSSDGALELGAELPGALPPGPPGPDRGADIAALVAAVQQQVSPDLGATTSAARDAGAAHAGDCTTYALAYAQLATARGIPTRVVTGLRVDEDRLVRHRWAISWTGRAWIAVDAAFGAAPAGGDLIGLAVHDADDAGLIAGESALARVRGARWLP